MRKNKKFHRKKIYIMIYENIGVKKYNFQNPTQYQPVRTSQ